MSLINATKMSRARRNATENPFIIHQGAPKRGEIYDRILEKMIQMTDRPLKRRNKRELFQDFKREQNLLVIQPDCLILLKFHFDIFAWWWSTPAANVPICRPSNVLVSGPTANFPQWRNMWTALCPWYRRMCLQVVLLWTYAPCFTLLLWKSEWVLLGIPRISNLDVAFLLVLPKISPAAIETLTIISLVSNLEVAFIFVFPRICPSAWLPHDLQINK